MSDRTGNFNAQKPRDAEQETKESCDQGPPTEDSAVPGAALYHVTEKNSFAVEDHCRKKEDSRPDVCPPCQLNG